MRGGGIGIDSVLTHTHQQQIRDMLAVGLTDRAPSRRRYGFDTHTAGV